MACCSTIVPTLSICTLPWYRCWVNWVEVCNSLHNFIQHMVLYFLSIYKVVLIFNSPLYCSTYLFSRPKKFGPLADFSSSEMVICMNNLVFICFSGQKSNNKLKTEIFMLPLSEKLDKRRILTEFWPEKHCSFQFFCLRKKKKNKARE